VEEVTSEVFFFKKGVILKSIILALIISTLIFGCKMTHQGIDIIGERTYPPVKSYDEEIKQARILSNTRYDSEILDAIEALSDRVSLLEKKNKPTGK